MLDVRDTQGGRLKIASVKVGAHRYRVEAVATPALEDDKKWADNDTRRRVVRVQTWERPGPSIVSDLLHECFHAWCEDAGGGWDKDDEERIASLLAPRLTAFLADNPEAVREIMRMLK